MDDCRDSKELLNPYIDDELSETEKIRFERHLNRCEKCKMEYRQYQNLSGLYNNIPLEELPSDFGTKLHERLVEHSASVKMEYNKTLYRKIINFSYVAAALFLIAIVAKWGLLNYYESRKAFETTNTPLRDSGAENSKAIAHDAEMPTVKMQANSDESGGSGGKRLMSEGEAEDNAMSKSRLASKSNSADTTKSNSTVKAAASAKEANVRGEQKPVSGVTASGKIGQNSKLDQTGISSKDSNPTKDSGISSNISGIKQDSAESTGNKESGSVAMDAPGARLSSSDAQSGNTSNSVSSIESNDSSEKNEIENQKSLSVTNQDLVSTGVDTVSSASTPVVDNVQISIYSKDGKTDSLAAQVQKAASAEAAIISESNKQELKSGKSSIVVTVIIKPTNYDSFISKLRAMSSKITVSGEKTKISDSVIINISCY